MTENGLQSRPVSNAELEGMVDHVVLYAIVDACDEPAVYEKVRELGPDRALCLHGGDLEEEERRVAPYLLRVDEEMMRWIMGELWGRPWGIFLLSDHDERTLRPHLRSMLSAEGPEGDPMYLRYYDPRVTAGLFESFSRGQLEEVMKPLKGIVVPSVDGEDGSELYYRSPT